MHKCKHHPDTTTYPEIFLKKQKTKTFIILLLYFQPLKKTKNIYKTKNNNKNTMKTKNTKIELFEGLEDPTHSLQTVESVRLGSEALFPVEEMSSFSLQEQRTWFCLFGVFFFFFKCIMALLYFYFIFFKWPLRL